MVQIDVSLAAAVGSTLAAAANVQLRDEPRLFRNGYLAGTVAFCAFFLVPSILFFLGSWPAWDTMYWWDRDTVPGWLAAFCAASMMATGALGFVAGHALIRKKMLGAALALPVVFLIEPLVVIAVFHDRFLHVGTLATFASGAPANLFSSDLLWAQVTVIPIWTGVPLAVLAMRWAKPAVRELRARRSAAAATDRAPAAPPLRAADFSCATESAQRLSHGGVSALDRRGVEGESRLSKP